MIDSSSGDRLRGSFAEVLQGQSASLLALAHDAADDEELRGALAAELHRVRDRAAYLEIDAVVHAADSALGACADGSDIVDGVRRLVDIGRALAGLETVLRPMVLIGEIPVEELDGFADEHAAVVRSAADVTAGLDLAAQLDPSAFVVSHDQLDTLVDQRSGRLSAVPVYAYGPPEALEGRLTAARKGARAWFDTPLALGRVLRRVRRQVSEANPMPHRVLVVSRDDVQFATWSERMADPRFELLQATDTAGVADAIEHLQPELVLLARSLDPALERDTIVLLRSHDLLHGTPVVAVVDEDAATAGPSATDMVLSAASAPGAQLKALLTWARKTRVHRQGLSVDVLTGTMGRETLLTAADREVRLARRTGQVLTVAFLDIDGMRRFNAQHGSAAGDQVLLIAAECLRQSFRETDLVGRVTSDCFGVLLPACISADAFRRIEDTRDAYASALERAGYPSLSFSVGLADTRDGMADVLARADRALHHARRSGRGHTMVWPL